jgi:putative lipoic acid-binding regulatory protein
MVRAEPDVRLQVDAIMERHAGPLDLSAVSERHSAERHFLGLTYVIHARSEQQIAELFAALKLCPQVLLVL